MPHLNLNPSTRVERVFLLSIHSRVTTNPKTASPKSASQNHTHDGVHLATANMLPGRRRLQQSTRGTPSTNRTRPAPPADNEPADLPPYQPQACALNPDAAASLRSLYQNLGTAKLDSHVRDSLTFLGAGTAALNATLQSSRYQVDNMGEKKKAEKARLVKEVEKLEEVTKGLTGDAEEAVRGLVDLKGEIEDEKGAFEQVVDIELARARDQEWKRVAKRRAKQERAALDGQAEVADGDDDDLTSDEEEDVQAVSTLIKDLQARKADNYAQMTMYQRYALNNDYADFKRQWHSGLHSEDAVLPDAKRWFSAEGHPIFNFGRAQGGDDEDVDGDTDLIVERAVVSTRCPLSLQEMGEPYANRRCKHVFEKAAIMEYIGRQGRVACPQSGCHVVGSSSSPSFSLFRFRFRGEGWMLMVLCRCLRRAIFTRTKPCWRGSGG